MRLPVKISYMNPQLETISRKAFEILQFRKLKYQLEYVYENNLFYRKKFQQAGITPEDIKTREDFSCKVPSTDKAEYLKDQEENPPYGLRLGVPRNKIAHTWVTGGTSGRSREMYGLTRSDMNITGNLNGLFCYYWAGVRKGDVAVNFLPIGMAGAAWSALEGFRVLGANGLFLGPYSTEVRLETMRSLGVNFMTCSPSYLNRLTEVCHEKGMDPKIEFPNLRSIGLITESFPIEWATIMEETWDARLHDRYGSVQSCSVIGHTCEKGAVPGGKRGCTHIFEWCFLVEVVDPSTGEHVKPGEQGEVVLTTLGKEASPSIRYRMHDKVTYLPYNYCDCGRPFASIETGTVGRYDDMIKIKGANVWPLDIDEILFSHKEIDEYSAKVFINDQGAQDVLIQVALRSDAAGLFSTSKEELFSDLVDRIKNRTGVTMRIKEVQRDALPVWDMKARRWTDERHKGLGVM